MEHGIYSASYHYCFPPWILKCCSKIFGSYLWCVLCAWHRPRSKHYTGHELNLLLPRLRVFCLFSTTNFSVYIAWVHQFYRAPQLNNFIISSAWISKVSSVCELRLMSLKSGINSIKLSAEFINLPISNILEIFFFMETKKKCTEWYWQNWLKSKESIHRSILESLKFSHKNSN